MMNPMMPQIPGMMAPAAGPAPMAAGPGPAAAGPMQFSSLKERLAHLRQPKVDMTSQDRVTFGCGSC